MIYLAHHSFISSSEECRPKIRRNDHIFVRLRSVFGQGSSGVFTVYTTLIENLTVKLIRSSHIVIAG